MVTMVRIALAFLRRDIAVYKRRMLRYIWQAAIWYPILYGTCFGYLLPRVGMGMSQTASSNIIFVGIILFSFSTLGFAINSDFLFDFERDRFIDYQLILLPSWMIVIERTIANSFILFISLLSYYPVLKLVFYDTFDLSQASFGKAIIILFLSSLLTTTIQVLYSCFLKSSKDIRHFWRRFNYPMSMLGGLFVPWKVMFLFSPLLGYAVLLNPMIYITEGLRTALLGGDQFFSFEVAVGMLIVYSLIITISSMYFFKKKVDPVF